MARVTDFLPTPSERELESMRDAVLLIAQRNDHQVDDLRLSCSFDELAGAVRFDLRFDLGGHPAKAGVLVNEAAIAGRYAREAFCDEVAKLFPPAPPLPPVYLDAGAGI
jgi:hypothetical protein